MKRVFNKTTAFTMVILICLSIVSPWVNTYASKNTEYILKILASNEYSDAVRFGDGYLLLKNGTFDNISKSTTYTFIDENGNKKELKNNIGFTEIYLNTSGDTYYVDYGALAVGKDGKVALMDMNGNLYGGSNNFYECVVHAGDNLFYTTNATANQEDKADTAIWTLRRKDGSVVKEFTTLDFYRDRVHSNGYEYIMDYKEGESELIVVNSDGNVKSMGMGYDGYTVYGEAGYVKAYKYIEGMNGYSITVFKEDGTKLFDLDKCSYIDMESLGEYGVSKVSLKIGDEWSETLVDINGNYIYELGKYQTISYYDNKKAIAIDYDANMYLVDHSDEIVFDIDEFAKGFGESYKAITFSSYYIDSTLTVTLVDESKENDIGNSFFFDENGKQLAGNIKGRISEWGGFNGTYASLYDNSTESYGVINKTGSYEKRGYDYLTLQDDPNESNLVAVADKESDQSKILIMKSGSDINKYDQVGINEWPYRMYVKGHLLVREKGTNNYGIIDEDGNEIISPGVYNNFTLYDDSQCILAYKNNKPYLFDTNGNVLNEENKYKNIGDYITTFYHFASGKNWTEYKDYMTSNNITITKDYLDKFGLVQVVKSDIEGNDVNLDVNGDGNIDILDMSMIAVKYNVSSTESGWDSKLDINKDNIIDLYDLTLIAQKL